MATNKTRLATMGCISMIVMRGGGLLYMYEGPGVMYYTQIVVIKIISILSYKITLIEHSHI